METNNNSLNASACELVEELIESADELRITAKRIDGGGTVLDFGVKSEGSLVAGMGLAEACMAGLGEVTLQQGSIDGISWPHVLVTTDHPTRDCLFSQYAGWKIAVDKFFAMGSGPMRAVAANEELFKKFNYRESSDEIVGILETASLPDIKVFEYIAEQTGVEPQNIDLLVAPTSSQAGNLQIVARSVETAMHKLLELGFDVNRVKSGWGVAPLSPVAADDMTGIGRTNDAILYGAQVTLWVRGDDDSLADIGPKVPANASEAHGRPFLEIFEEAGRDFYKIDPHLFSPAEITFVNLDSGRVHRFGRTAPDVLRKSFGI